MVHHQPLLWSRLVATLFIEPHIPALSAFLRRGRLSQRNRPRPYCLACRRLDIKLLRVSAVMMARA
jgi:hypothetical protein